MPRVKREVLVNPYKGPTPGPWSATLHTSESIKDVRPGCDWTITGPNGEAIAFEGNGTDPNASANLRLMVAAPTLLKCLELVKEKLMEKDDTDFFLIGAVSSTIFLATMPKEDE